jgi:hypothetical protein
MFHATIHYSGRSFCLSGDVVPYDLQLLREQVLARAARSTRVEVRCPEELRAAFLRVLANVEQRGVTLVVTS